VVVSFAVLFWLTFCCFAIEKQHEQASGKRLMDKFDEFITRYFFLGGGGGRAERNEETVYAPCSSSINPTAM